MAHANRNDELDTRHVNAAPQSTTMSLFDSAMPGSRNHMSTDTFVGLGVRAWGICQTTRAAAGALSDQFRMGAPVAAAGSAMVSLGGLPPTRLWGAAGPENESAGSLRIHGRSRGASLASAQDGRGGRRRTGSPGQAPVSDRLHRPSRCTGTRDDASPRGGRDARTHYAEPDTSSESNVPLFTAYPTRL